MSCLSNVSNIFYSELQKHPKTQQLSRAQLYNYVTHRYNYSYPTSIAMICFLSSELYLAKKHINGLLFLSEPAKTESYEDSVANLQPCQTLHYFQFACIFFYIKYQGDDPRNIPRTFVSVAS